MTHDRRHFLHTLAAAGIGNAAAPAARAANEATAAPHDMSQAPPSWTGKEQVAMLLYPGFTALDVVGPQYMLGNLMGATVHLVARDMKPVMSDTKLAIAPSTTLARCPRDLDVLFVPGGSSGTMSAMQDKALVRWLAELGARAKLITSVCTGSMLLGQAGLLHGKRATSHWATHALLSEFGAMPISQRVVWDGNVVTGAGVSAGLDLGLSIVAKLRDETYAQGVQLLAEYAPEPPFTSGRPESAPPAVRQMMGSMFEGVVAGMKQASRSARVRRHRGSGT